MFRFLFRLFGLLFLAAAFIVVVYDGTTSISTTPMSLHFTSVRALWDTINAASLANLRPVIEGRFGAFAWDPVFAGFLSAPSAAVLGVLGIIFVLLGRKKRPLIGYAR
jgi:hypothetical protein